MVAQEVRELHEALKAAAPYSTQSLRQAGAAAAVETALKALAVPVDPVAVAVA